MTTHDSVHATSVEIQNVEGIGRVYASLHCATDRTLQLVISHSHIAAPNQLDICPPFGSVITADALSRASTYALDRDFLLRKRFCKGNEIVIRIPSAPISDRFPRESIETEEQACAIYCRDGDVIRPLFLPAPDLALLFPYQRVGVAWLLNGAARLLADEMGLGKTVQTIYASRLLFNSGHLRGALVLAPKSLVLNWLMEFRRWAPELISVAISPNKAATAAVWSHALKNAHVVVSHYEQVRVARMALPQISIDLVVADEAHRLRNESSQISSSVRSLTRRYIWALTGTPIERDVEDLATLMALLEPIRFSITDATGSKAALRTKAAPFILRRTRDAVLPDLPAVSQRLESIELLPQQRIRYGAARQGNAHDGRKLSNALQIINELRRICDYDPRTGSSSKVLRISELLNEIDKLNEKAIVFSFLREPLRLLLKSLRWRMKCAVLDGTMSQNERGNIIHQFKTDQSIRVLLASSRVASEGLTLTEANHVVFFNKWWNPSANQQAQDRVNRIGQTRHLYIYNFVTVGTIEERLERLLSAKGQTYADIIGRLANLQVPQTEAEQEVVEALYSN